MVKFLLDACCEAEFKQVLEELGHNASHMLHRESSLPDPDVLKIARHEQRVLVTYDIEFAMTARFFSVSPVGLVVCRFGTWPQQARCDRLRSVVSEAGDLILGRLLIVHRSRLRIRPFVLYQDDTDQDNI